MVGAHLAAALVVHLELDLGAKPRPARHDLAEMDEQPVGLLLRVGDHDLEAVAADRAGVADLAARFAVERRLVDHHRNLGPFGGRIHGLAVAHHCRDHAFCLFRRVAEELGGAKPVAQFVPDGFRGRLAGAGPAGAGLGLLPLHGVGEAGDVDRNAALAQRILREVERKAVGVVEPEGRLAVEHVARGQVLRRVGEQPEPARQGLAEPRFLELQRLGDQRLAAHQFGIGLAHLSDQRRNQPVHQRFGTAQKLAVPHGAAHDAPQNVAAALVGRQHAVGDEEAGRAQVVGDDAEGGNVVVAGPAAERRGGRVDQMAEQVGLEDALDALQDRGHALEPHARIDRGPRQGNLLARLRLVELHEDQVPELEEAVAILLRTAGRAAPDMLAAVDEDFRTRAARPGIAHGPEIVAGGDADDALVREAGDLLPQRGRLVVGVVDRDEQLVLRQAEILGNQLPGELDRDVLEIVAEREIAEHLEEGEMARRIADIVEVVVLAAGAHRFLRGGGAAEWARLEAGEDVLELHHAGIGEHQCRIVARHERARGHHLVSVGPEEVEKCRPDLVDATHELPLATSRSGRTSAGARQAF